MTMAETRAEPGSIEQVQALAASIHDAVASVIAGKDEVIRTAIVTLLAEGHLLIEDVPGVGKTMLAKALAKAIGSPMRRIQFTPDLLPSDITGVSIFDQRSSSFEFRRGAIFANVVVGDEINRASPKTQSALLECMEERQVTVDGITYELARPFIVMATQNPIEMEGTYPLPEAQRDRFMARISMGYPSASSEIAMLTGHGAASPLTALQPVTDGPAVLHAIEQVATVYASPALQQYIVDLVGTTRSTSALRLGASPRASLALLRASRATAALAGRDYVIPEDVLHLIVPVLGHRIILSSENQHLHRGPGQVLNDLLRRVPVPRSAG